MLEKSEDILPLMKKIGVKYLAIRENGNGMKEFSSLKSKVKEFELCDIQVLNYDDLHIKLLKNIATSGSFEIDD